MKYTPTMMSDPWYGPYP